MNVNQQDTKDTLARGGPRTASGKSISRRNAVKHGLSAKTLLPEILDCDLVDQHYERLRNEWQPATPTEDFFVREMARHQAYLVRIEAIEIAVLRRSVRRAPTAPGNDDKDDDVLEDALACAGTSIAVERITRYRRPHERAYTQALAELREVMSFRATRGQKSPSEQRPAFTTEAECEAYLIARLTGDDPCCPKCGKTAGHWIASRKILQCRTCRRQIGIRSGTVMEKSRLGLLPWFKAVEALLEDPKSSTAQLVAATGIQREGTVRRIASKIRSEMDSKDMSSCLAGLDRIYGQSRIRTAEPSVRK